MNDLFMRTSGETDLIGLWELLQFPDGEQLETFRNNPKELPFSKAAEQTPIKSFLEFAGDGKCILSTYVEAMSYSRLEDALIMYNGSDYAEEAMQVPYFFDDEMLVLSYSIIGEPSEVQLYLERVE